MSTSHEEQIAHTVYDGVRGNVDIMSTADDKDLSKNMLLKRRRYDTTKKTVTDILVKFCNSTKTIPSHRPTFAGSQSKCKFSHKFF